MWKEFFTAIIHDPEKIVFIIAVFLCAYLIFEFKKRLQNDFLKFEASLAKWENKIYEHVGKTESILATHLEQTGRYVKAINGDMLRIKDSALGVREDFVIRIDQLRELVFQTTHEVQSMAVTLQRVTERVESRFGKTLDFKKELEIMRDQVQLLETWSEEFRTLYAKQRDRVGQMGKALRVNYEEIQKIKKQNEL